MNLIIITQFILQYSFTNKKILCDQKGKKERNVYLMTHSTHFIYGYMVSDIWLKTTVGKGGNLLLLLHGLLFPISSKESFIGQTNRQDSTYHDLCYTSCEALKHLTPPM